MSNNILARVSTVFGVLVVCTTLTAESPATQDWDQWRGPQRDGRIASQAWPKNLSSANLSLTWSVPQGPSYSGPIVVGDQVFVTETKDSQYEVVRALDRKTGNQLWATEWAGSMKVPFFAAANGSWIRATPAYDDNRLYVAGMKDVLVCLDTTSGDVIWKVDFVADTGSKAPSFGGVSSPLIVGDFLFIQAGNSLAKLEKSSGKMVWQSLRNGAGMMKDGAFSSPVIANLAGQMQLVVQTRSHLTGVDMDSGAELWSVQVPAFRGMNILTPTIIGDSVFTSSYGGRSTLFQVSNSSGNWSVDEVWNHKSQGYMSSPVVVNGHIYMHLRNQRFVCLDAATGAERWTSKPFGKYCSMVANGDSILALDERGELLLIAATPEEFRLIDRSQVAEDSWAHLAVVGEELFIRDLAATRCFKWNEAASLALTR